MTAEVATHPQRRSRWRSSRWVVAALGVSAVLVALGMSIYVFPPSSELPKRADVIYVIGPPTEGRIDLAEKLHEEGVASDILISVPLDGEQSAAELSVCQRSFVTCAHPEPFTTAGEMMLLDSRYGADATAIVVTFTPHVSRTRFIAERCAEPTVTVVAAPTSLSPWEWLYQFAYQTGGFAKAFAQSCR